MWNGVSWWPTGIDPCPPGGEEIWQNPVMIAPEVTTFDADGLLTPCIPDDPTAVALWESGVMVEQVKGFLNRWNRTVAYKDQGIFEAVDVPAGQSVDFIELSVIGKRKRIPS